MSNDSENELLESQPVHTGTDTGESALTVIVESRQWWREQYKQKTMTILVLLMALGLSVTLNIAQVVMMPTPKYFAQNADLTMTEMVPLDEPYVTQQGVTDWSVSVLSKIISLRFDRVEEQLTEVKPMFFDRAFADFVRSLKSAGTIDMVRSNRLIMNPSLLSSPIITGQGKNESNIMTWRISVPIMISYESSQGVFLNQKVSASMLIERVSLFENEKGILVRQLVLTPYKGR